MPDKDSALIPLNLVNFYTRTYPSVWDAAQKFRDWDEQEANWDKSKCYIPVAAGCAICDLFSMPRSAIYMVPALAAWRQSKEVYTFDPDLAETLYEQASDTKLPCAVLMRMPFYCVYIDSGKYRFFCHLENDVNDGRWELRFVRIDENGNPVASYLHLGDFTLDESIMAGHEEGLWQTEHIRENKAASSLFSSALAQGGAGDDYRDVYDRTTLSEMLQLVLYICADNADIVQPDGNKRTYRRSDSGAVKDKYREVRKWDTGFYVGNALRKERNSSGSYEKRPYQGGTKRPHMRRGHWHHFWKGKEGNKELVLHWVLPIFVKGENADGENPVRITPVK